MRMVSPASLARWDDSRYNCSRFARILSLERTGWSFGRFLVVMVQAWCNSTRSVGGRLLPAPGDPPGTVRLWRGEPGAYTSRDRLARSRRGRAPTATSHHRSHEPY